MSPKMPPTDGETRTSRVIGSVDFVRPQLPKEEEEEKALVVVNGVKCCIPFTIKCGASGATEALLQQVSSDVFDEVESKLNMYNPNSEVSQINRMEPGVAHEMSPVLSEVVLASKDMVKMTRGAFDPSVAPLLAHYKERATSNDTKQQKPPLDDTYDTESLRRQLEVMKVWKGLMEQGFGDDSVSKKVKRILEYSHWSGAFSVGMYKDDNVTKIRKPPNGNNNSQHRDTKIFKRHADARLDLCGIAKGWAVDEIAKILPSPCYVEWGGDIKVCGTHPSGRGWMVAVPEPPSLSQLVDRVVQAKKDGHVGPVFSLSKYVREELDDESQNYLAVLELHDGDAVATSGDYETVVEKDGKLYSHIVNPRLGVLTQLNDVTLAQAVVVCKSCMFADALATAALVQKDPALARAMLEPFRTGFRFPISDFMLYARRGPRIVRLSIPGVELAQERKKRLQLHQSGKVVVVGSGLAGMSAAIEAADAGASVIILEKEPRTGGNSAKATSGINGWGTETQAHQGVADEERLFERDTFISGKGGHCKPSLVRTLSTQSAPAIHWLKKRFNIPLTVLSQLGGHSAKRTHRAPPDEQGRPVPIGYLITKTLRDCIDTQYADKIEVRCGQKVTRLLYSVDEEEVKTVTGVEITDDTRSYELHADAVILATGGFGCDQSNSSLMSRFRPDLLGTPTTNGSFAQGDGVLLGEEVGAELVDMDKIQLHPTGFIDPKKPDNPTKFLAPEAMRGSGGILVNSEGKRFVNELDLRSVVAKAIQENCFPYVSGEYVGPPFAWCILSQDAKKLFGEPVLGFYKNKLGLFDDCENVKAAAALIGCNENALSDTLKDYAEASELGACSLTSKHVFPAEITPDSEGLVLARVTPSIHYTMGGLNINAAGEVQERIKGLVGQHRHIRRLYAAGEVTGGVHGNNRLGGNSLLECVVFGRVAGERAATVNQPVDSMFPRPRNEDDERNWSPVVLREVRNTDKKYGINTREVRFNLHGSLQTTGLAVGQFIALRGEMDGETLMGYFSPITRPDDEGLIGILCRTDMKGGPITRLLEHIRPGSVMYMCPMGGLRLEFNQQGVFYKNREVRRIGLLAGGTGIAPMLQIVRAFNEHALKHEGVKIPRYALNLIYAAEEGSDLAYIKVLEDIRDAHPEIFRFYLVLNRPPIGWTEGVGFIEPQDIKKQLVYPPKTGDLVVMCGPPIFEASMRKSLARLGFQPSQWYSFSADDNVSSRL